MPKILERDPAWLVGAATPGLNLFLPEAEKSASPRRPTSAPTQGPLRRIAHRGTELFVAVGNEIRWSDLAVLKDAEANDQKVYRVLKTPVHRDITQLSISPSGTYIAILTSHTCHVCILPGSSFRATDSSPLRLKSFQLGPTAHVLEQSPLVSAIWHHLSPTGSCLVTVTLDACIRLWELDSENRSSFDQPALAVDLKKLGNAASLQEDFSASKYGTNKGFSPDDVEMQVAAACFGGLGRDDEHGWASMTLWVAMTEGDVYALCPFLPSKWFAPASLLPSLSTSVTEKSRAISADLGATQNERRVVDEQWKWLRHVDSQEPMLAPGQTEFDAIEVYARPDCVSVVPKLQGPFSISPEPDFGEITDIYVVAPKVDDEALFDGEHDGMSSEEGLSVGIVCLATSTNEVHVCLDLDGVEAQWLPKKRSRAFNLDDVDEEKELLLFETIDLARSESEDNGWPSFTVSPVDRYEAFVTSSTGVCGLSFRPWVALLEDELSAPTDSGAGLRLDVVLESSSTLVDQPISMPREAEDGINASLALTHPAFGYIILTVAKNAPFAAVLDLPPVQSSHPYLPDAPAPTAALPAPEPRAPYRPAPAFDQPSSLPQLLKLAQEKELLGSDPKRQVRFSPATLQVMTEAHRIMSAETHRLGLAAADLFRRCERMRSELQEQVRKVAEVAERVDNVTGQDGPDDSDDAPGDEQADSASDERLVGKDKIEHRIQQSEARTAELGARVDALRRKMLRLGGRQLSHRELAFAEEVTRLQRSVLPSSQRNEDEDDADHAPISASSTLPSDPGALIARFDAVGALRERLVSEATAAAAERASSSTPAGSDRPDEGEGGSPLKSSGIGASFRRQKLAQVMALLEREAALIDAVAQRLAKLQAPPA